MWKSIRWKNHSENGVETEGSQGCLIVAGANGKSQPLLNMPGDTTTTLNGMIRGVAGIGVRPRGGVNFKVAGVKSGGKQIELENSTISKVTADLAMVTVSSVTK